ncbi:MAG: hypothetical protein ACOYO1_06370 [Bacteroidales bacterium]
MLVKGEKYRQKYLLEKDFEFINESTIFLFYRKGINAFVFEKPIETTHDDEYILIEIWKD